MNYLIRNANVFLDNGFVKADLFIKDGIISDISSNFPSVFDAVSYDMNNCFIFPGLIDVHVHLREPGFFYKETIADGTHAAAHGGFTAVCSMPNLNPVPDCLENLRIQQEIISSNALVHVHPYGSITVGERQGELSDMHALAPHVVAFSDDGVGVQSSDMMENAMKTAKELGKIIAAHCEVNSLLGGRAIHNGKFAEKLGIRGISSESEWREVARDIELVRKTGCDLHICHVSTKESVALVRAAKAQGLPVSCETAAHYLTLCEEDLRDEGCFRMNPPLRTAEDKKALLEGIADGTIEIIASDHAPHLAEEKSGGLLDSLNGIVGLETTFPVLYTKLVRSGKISLERLIELMQVNPAKRFGIGTPIKKGQPADLTVFDLNEEYTINSEEFFSKGKSSPFVGDRVFGKCKLTMVSGKPVYKDK